MIFGSEKISGKKGRWPTPFCIVFNGIIYVLRTDCQWQAIPREKYEPGSTVHGWFTKWVATGLFEKAWKEMLLYYDDQIGIGWKWQSLDGVITKAPLGGAPQVQAL